MAPRPSPAARRALRPGQCGAKSTSGTSAVSLMYLAARRRRTRRAQLSYGCHDDSCGSATTTARPSPSATRAAVHGTTPSSLAPLESPHVLSVLFRAPSITTQASV
uniref:Uncharacterized protein n=1 Tax=Oryza barthii TaxID=65489 RepID=A0A0D3GP01_9ORYZ